MGSVPGWGTKIPHAVWCGQKKKSHSRYVQIYNIFLAVNGNRSFGGFGFFFFLNYYRFLESDRVAQRGTCCPLPSFLPRSYIIVVEYQNRELDIGTVCVCLLLSVSHLLQICVSTTAAKIINLSHDSCPHLQCHTHPATHTPPPSPSLYCPLSPAAV